MRQSLPHRNNIHLRRMKCKGFVGRPWDLARNATFLPQHFRRADMPAEKLRMTNNGLVVSFFLTVLMTPQMGMAGMHLRHDNNVKLTHRHGGRP
jgi:hypothetical protein